MSETAKPGIIDRLRARYGWFDHIMRAVKRFRDSKGSFYAAGLTYYTIFALFPLLMVGFSLAGFLLSRRKDLLSELDNRIRSSVSPNLGHQLTDLMGSAINSRASVGVIGLLAAAWAGLGWMTNFREALSQMWHRRAESAGYLRTKLSDLVVMLALFVVILASIALTALGQATTMATVLGWFGIHDLPALGGILRVVSLLVSFLVSWLLFTWMIAWLPRESIGFVSSLRAGLIAAMGFEVLKQVASIYLRLILHGVAGVTFGPVLGLMVFAYFTAQLVLLATAWAATSSDHLDTVVVVQPPGPAIITPRVQVEARPMPRQTLAALAVGALGALGVSRLVQRRRHR